MCILVVDDEMKRRYLDQAKLAGLQDEQLEPSVIVYRKIKNGGKFLVLVI